jgi:hypothetical protein
MWTDVLASKRILHIGHISFLLVLKLLQTNYRLIIYRHNTRNAIIESRVTFSTGVSRTAGGCHLYHFYSTELLRILFQQSVELVATASVV